MGNKLPRTPQEALRRAQTIARCLVSDDGMTRPPVLRREARRLLECLDVIEAARVETPPRRYTLATLPPLESWPTGRVEVTDARNVDLGDGRFIDFRDEVIRRE